MLESYIAPLFMGYVDKYIKNLKPSDLNLSLWSGDVVLHNLELNLDVLQKELNLPVKFLSGRIYKLQIHVPWTRLVYDPVVIGIDTMEFVIKLRDASDEQSDDSVGKASAEHEVKEQPSQTTESEQLPPGYVQSILNKVINNVSFKINNIIIKYVEDDIVFSLNVKSVDFYGADKNWQKAFIELSLPDLLLRRVCDITDLTICLDQQNSTGRIEIYQDPVLYKCNLTCRLVSRYKGLSSTKAVDNNINIYCDSCDFSLTDLQIPMVVRLMKLVIGLFYGTLDLPGCNIKKHTAPKIIKKHKVEQQRRSTALNVTDDPSTVADTSWSAWAWSIVPGFDSAASEEQSNIKLHRKLKFAIYVTQVTVTLKRTNMAPDLVNSQRLEFSPVLALEFSGCVLEFTSIGDLVIDINVGVQRLLGYLIGKQCTCTPEAEEVDDVFDETAQVMDDVFIKVGCQSSTSHPLSFLKKSLFANFIEEDNDMNETLEGPVLSSEKVEDTSEIKESINSEHKEKDPKDNEEYKPGFKFTDTEIAGQYGTIFLNYYYEMKLPSTASSEIENIFLYPEADESVPEVSDKRIHLSQAQLFISTKCVHAMKWLTEALIDKSTSRKEKSGVFLDPFVVQQLQLGNFLSRTFTITCRNSEMYLFCNDHEEGACSYTDFQVERESAVCQLDALVLKKLDPMYPTELQALVEKGKLVKLNRMENMNSNISLKVENLQFGISLLNLEVMEAFSLVVLQPTDFTIDTTFSMITNAQESKVPIINSEYCFNCHASSFSITKSHVILLYQIVSSWSSFKDKHFVASLADSVFGHQGGTPLMNIDVTDIYMRLLDLKDISCCTASINSVTATLQYIGENGQIETSLLLQTPCNTSSFCDVRSWLKEASENDATVGAEPNKFIDIKFQFQNENCVVPEKFIQMILLSVSGATVNLDPLFFEWLDHKIDLKSARKKPPPVRRQTIEGINQSLTASTPRRSKSYARVFGGSNTSSHHSKEKLKSSETNEKKMVNDTVSKEKDRFGEWMARKINLFKSFHVKIDIASTVFLFPNKCWPAGYEHMEHLVMLTSLYHEKKQEVPSTLLVCLPKLNIVSSNQQQSMFSQPLPILTVQIRRKMETLPWSVTSKDFAAVTLFPNMEHLNFDDRIDTLHLCKPITWTLFVASATPNNAFPKASSSLEVISESSGSSLSKAFPNTRAIWVCDSKGSLGFVLHMDWSVCEVCVSQQQLKLVYNTLNTIYQVSTSLNSSAVNLDTADVKDTTTSAKDTSKLADVNSVSSASVVDQVDAFSTITGSSSIFPKQKEKENDINVSLWIQCTIPKVKVTILSEDNKLGALYRVVSEIEEIMFAFDYQDNVLELTNKIASCVVYYSLLRFDQEPEGWINMENGYLLCQKEKFKESTHADSKTLLSVVYRRTHQYLESILSPEVNDETTGGAKVFSDHETNTSVPSTTLCYHKEHIVKHEATVHFLSFDLICDSKPILSCLDIFVNLFSSGEMSHGKPDISDKIVSDSMSSVLTLPLLTVHCDSVRVIVPVGDMCEDSKFKCIDQTENVFLFHFNSLDLNSSPSNPITKTVTDKTLYRQAKNSHRENLKKLKLWNVQYQLNVVNVGLCSTNWKSIEHSLPSKYKHIQNPALEWNSHSGYNQQMIIPIFPGFDFKATVAPPIFLHSKTKFIPATAAAFEFHSPQEIKVFISADQISLALQVVRDFNSLIVELSSLFPSKPSESKPSSIPEDVPVDSGFQTKDKSDVLCHNGSSIPPIEVFAFVSGVSIILYHRETIQPLVTSLFPALHLNLLQPTCNVTTIREKKVVVNLLSFALLTSSNTQGIKGDILLPLPGDFDVALVTSGKGIVNEQTGLLPTFFTASLVLQHGNNIAMDVKLGKPLTLKYEVSMNANVQKFITNLRSILASPTDQLDQNNFKSDIEIKEQVTSGSFKISKISFCTERVQFCVSASLTDENNFIHFQYQSLASNLSFDHFKNGPLRRIDVSSQIKGAEVFFSQNHKRSNLLMPLNGKVNVLMLFCSHSGNHSVISSLPRCFFWVDFGLVQLNINQKLYNIATSVFEEFNVIVQESSDQEVEQSQSNPVKEVELSAGQDDLRNGQFEYVMQNDTGLEIPPEYQIVFTNEMCSSPTMTWTYPEVRVVTDVSILPVPFHITNEVRSHWIEDTDTIPCILEYWDEISHSFVACVKFFLSENDAATVTITNETDAVNLISAPMSQTWRVVVLIPDEIYRHGSFHNKNESVFVTPVPATSLAACMKVNSKYSAELVSSLQASVHFDTIHVTISNSMNCLGQTSPTLLTPYYIDKNDTYPESMDAMRFTIEGVDLGFTTVQKLNLKAKVSFTIQASVMDFNDYHWLNLLKRSEFSLALSQPLSAIDGKSPSLKVDIKELDLCITQTSVHTIKQMVECWRSLNNCDAEILLFSHYALCNDTQDVLHIQQVGTDEDIVLRSGQCYAYSWCSFKDPLLRFCIESAADWKWSDAININELGTFPRKIDHVGFASQIFVEVKTIAGLQKQVVFRGSCSFVNNLMFDVHVEVVTQETDISKCQLQQNIVNKSKTFLLPSGVTRPSLTASTSFLRSLRISKCESETEEKNFTDIQVVLNKEEFHEIIQLKDGSKISNCWLSLNYSSDILGHLVVSLSPLFILCSHLAEPCLISISSSDNVQNQEDIVMHGKGKELQVFTLCPEIWYAVSFCLAGSKEYSLPGYPINSSQFELLRKDKDNIHSCDNGDWPFINGQNQDDSCELFGQKVSYKTGSTSTKYPSQPTEQRDWHEAELFFQSSLKWHNLPTVFVELKPKILVTNKTDDVLFIKSLESGYVYTVEGKTSISPFHDTFKFSLGIKCNGTMLWSSSVTVRAINVDPPSPNLEERLVPGSSLHRTIIDSSTQHCYQFSFTCNQGNGMLSVCVKKRFVIHNLSQTSLLMVPLMTETLAPSQIFTQLSTQQLHSKSDTECSFFNTHQMKSLTSCTLLMNFVIQSTDAVGNVAMNARLENHDMKKSQCLLLSEEHLRECILLDDASESLIPFVVTSSFLDGVIHVFIDMDTYPLVLIHNNTNIDLMLKELDEHVVKKQTRHDVLCSDQNMLFSLPSNSIRQYYPSTCKQLFPKVTNTIDLYCQLGCNNVETVELSQHVHLEKDANLKVFVPEHGEVVVTALIRNSQLHVEISGKEESVLTNVTPLSQLLLNVTVKTINVVVADYQYHNKVQSLFSGSIASTKLLYDVNLTSSVFKLSVGYLQVDNQLEGSCYHFPVILLPMRGLSERYHTVRNDAPFPEVEACPEADFFTITFECGRMNGDLFLDNVRVNVQPCEMYLEDTFLYQLAAVIDSYMPPCATTVPDPLEVALTSALSILHPLKICNVDIGELSVLLSVHASVKVFLAADHIPLVLGRYKNHPTQTVMKEFIRSILYHYATQALVRAGWILGSLEILGNPTGLIRNIGRGVSDFFVMPYSGLIRGPTAFVSGLSHGTASFLKHVSTGALTSINNLSSSISRNLDRLCFDEMHLIMQEERRAQSPTRVVAGFGNAFGSLGLSLLGAVAGIVDHPIQNLTTANNASEALSGVVTGFAKGMVGMVTKPIGGAMEFVSQASQGILQGVGLVRSPERLISLKFNSVDDLRRQASQMKFLWQYLHMASCQNLFIISDVNMVDSQSLELSEQVSLRTGKDIPYYSKCVVILTETALFIYQVKKDKITSAFPLKDIDLVRAGECQDSSGCKMRIVKNSLTYGAGETYNLSLDENPNFRQFFESFQKSSSSSVSEACYEHLLKQNNTAVLEVEMPNLYADLLLTWCKANRRLLMEETSCYDSLNL